MLMMGKSYNGFMAMATELENYIRQAAIQRGIDPDVALRVARSEGGVNDPVRQSDARKNGIREPSYGPFQLLVGGGNTGFPTGMGNDFISKYGVSPSDPSAAYKGIDFALDGARDKGWGAWYGAKAQGITGKMGIGGSPSPAANDALDINKGSQTASAAPSGGLVSFGTIGSTNTSQRPESAPIVPSNTAVPAAVMAQANPNAESKDGKLAGLFNLLAQVNSQQEQAPQPAQIQGPTPQQSQALAMALQSIRGRLV